MQESHSREVTANLKSFSESFFRPSDSPALNTNFDYSFYGPLFGKKADEIVIPDELTNTPENTILNYFSILREALNLEEGKSAGCGTIGYATIPYPVAYQFLSVDYQTLLSYEKYLKSFENILHISLIKFCEVPIYDNENNTVRYFVELETIEGTEKNIGVFAYYYGYIDLNKKNKVYRITDLNFYGENFLCAPYHGWQWDAIASVQIRYGGWCHLIKELHEKTQEDYVINVPFLGTDGFEYRIVFYRLTNNTDLEIAQYRKKNRKDWELIQLHPQDCLEKEWER